MAMVVINGLLPFTFNRDGYVTKGGSVKPSVWSDVQTINAELKMYATYRDGVSYFDTDVFFKDPRANADQLQIDKELMTDYLHPSPAGYRLWGEEIVEALDALLIGEEEVDDVL
jgi:lysophospholipase L1-like esterase